jgi:transposase
LDKRISGVFFMQPYGNRRNHQKAQYWRENLRQQERSGLSIRDYCRREGLKETAFYRWRSKLACREKEATTSRPAPEQVRFLPVRITAEASAEDGGVELHLGQSRRIKVYPGFDQQTLREVLAVLENDGC